MRHPLTRRDLMALLGGSAVGALLTPMPWKLSDDLSIWTQNWGWTPKLPRGPVETKLTTCGLCPTGCALRAACVAGVPFRLSSASGDGGSLCAIGYGGHHLAYHPRRLRGPVARLGPRIAPGDVGAIASREGSIEGATHRSVPLVEVQGAVARALIAAGRSGGRVAVLDARPGRSLSLFYRRFLEAAPRGLYLTAARGEERSLSVLASMLGTPETPLGWDLDRTETILSFGAPILDGWSGSASLLARRRSTSGASRRPRILQAETRPSLTALAADRWLPLRPGTEATFALGLAHVIVREGWFDAAALRAGAKDFETESGRDFRHLIDPLSPERAAEVTGLRPEQIAETARDIALRGPSIVLGGGDPGGGPLGHEEEVALNGLNLLLGAVGRAGGIAGRATLGAPAVLDSTFSFSGETLDLREASEGSVSLLIIDGAPSGEAVPWPLVERLLADEALVVSLSPYLTGAAARADYVVPGPAHLEAIEEAATPPGGARASFAVTAPLLPARRGSVDPIYFLRAAAGAAGIDLPECGRSADLIEARARAIHATGRGEVVGAPSGEVSPVSAFASFDPFWKAIREGARWRDDAAVAVAPSRFTLLGPCGGRFDRLEALASGRLTREAPGDSPLGLALMPFGQAGAVGEGPVAPLVSKVYRESRLRTGPGRALLSPSTAAVYGVSDGARIVLETTAGAVEAIAQLDRSIMPGVVHAAAGPDPDRLGETGEGAGTALVDLCARTSLESRAVRARVREV